MNFEMSKIEYSEIKKIKIQAKESVQDFILKALKKEYGEENVRMIRSGKTSQKNEIGIVIGTVTIPELGEREIVETISCSTKDFVEYLSKSGTQYFPFDFKKSVENYDNYLSK